MRVSGRRRGGWLVAVTAVMIAAGCRGTTDGLHPPQPPLSSSAAATPSIPTSVSSPEPTAYALLETDDGGPSIADDAPWGIDVAPRMPFEIDRIEEVFRAMPAEVSGFQRSVVTASNGYTPILRYDDAAGSPVALVVPVAFPLQGSAPALVRELAANLRLVWSAQASELDDAARIVFVAGGIVGADPPVHALIWAYSDRGFAFVLTATSVEARKLIARALAETLVALESGAGRGPGTIEARPTCTTNAAGDNLKC